MLLSCSNQGESLWILYNLLKFVFLLSISLMLLVFMFWDVSSPKLPGQRNVSLSEALLLTCYELLGERSCLMIATSHTVKRYIRNDPSVVKDALQFLSSCRINPYRKLPAVLKENSLNWNRFHKQYLIYTFS